VLVPDTQNNRVCVFLASVRDMLSVIGSASPNVASAGTTSSLLVGPTSVATDSAKNVYVADAGNNRILVFLSSPAMYSPGFMWNASEVIGQTSMVSKASANPPTLQSLAKPQHILVGPLDVLYVCDTNNNRVLFYSQARPRSSSRVYGQPSFTQNTPGAGRIGLNNPVSAALDVHGRLYVADLKNNRIIMYV
jgi:DNA-binding beta-propeller fold protein YncE